MMQDLLPVAGAPARTFGSIALSSDNTTWVLTGVEPHVCIRLKAIFPRIAKGSAGPFKLPHERMTDADLDWFLTRYPLTISEADRAAMSGGVVAHIAAQAALERIMLPGYQPPPYVGLQPGQEVRHYQGQAIDLAIASGALLLGDECGLGKTFTAAGLCLRPGTLPAAIVCQVHIQKQWVKVIEAFTTLKVHAVRKTIPYDLPPADVYVFRYSQLAGWADIFATGLFRTAVYDEPQELRTGTSSNKGTAARVLTDNTSFRLGLTATPIYGYGIEIFNVMGFIKPGVFGSFQDFSIEYMSDERKLKDPRAVGTFLREQHVFLRRTKKDVGKELEPVSRIVDTVSTDPKAVQSIEATARALAIRATHGSFVERGNAARDLDMLVRHATGVAKAPAVARVVRILVESGAPVVLFGWHRDVYDIWMRDLKDLNPMLYTGSESGAQKVRAKDAFLAGETDLLIMSLRSAAGLDGLQARSSTCVFGELDWSPGIHHQCIERLDREGQADPVTALFLVSEEGSDPPMMEVLGLKASEAHQVVDPTLGVTATNADGGRIKALVDRYLERAGAVVEPEEIESVLPEGSNQFELVMA